jgi:pimeloyl-ACP methyl ester carboxylesterase
VLATELLGKTQDALTADDEALLEQTLLAPTGCVRDAEPAVGSFPLVVVHSGAGSSFEDDAGLCEYLARHGNVVVGSAFPKEDGSSFAIDGRAGSARDMEFLIARAHELPSVDATRVALVGHSAGAQAILRYACQHDCPADALVLLDTTADYYDLAFPLHRELIDEVLAHVEPVGQPMLVVASPEAQFQLCDRLVRAERTYLTEPELGHNEHISQGHQRNELDLRRGQTSDGEPVDAEHVRSLRARYDAECADVRLFLDAELRGQRAPFVARIAELKSNPLGGPDPCIERVPRGVHGPPPYDFASGRPPTPRQLAPMLHVIGAEHTCAVLARFQDREPRSPIYQSTMVLGSLLFALVESGKEDEARTLHAYARSVLPEVLSLFTFATEVTRAGGHVDDARRIVHAALVLEPENEEFLRIARELEP